MFSSTTWAKVSALAAVAFAVLFTVGVMSAASGEAETNDEYVRYFSDSGHQAKAVIAFYLLIGAAAAFLVFIAGVRERIRATAAESSMVLVIMLFAVMVAVATVAGAAAIAAVSGDAVFGGESSGIPQDGGVLRAFESMGFGLLAIAAALFGALCAALASVASLRSGALPKWLGITGLVCAATLLASPFVPPIGLPLWALAAAVPLWRGATPRTVSVPATAAAS